MDDRYITRRFDPPLTACLEGEKGPAKRFVTDWTIATSSAASIRRQASKLMLSSS
jgi:hypothetical protein